MHLKLTILAAFICSISFGQTTLFFEDFETSPQFDINTTDLGGNTNSQNYWTINNGYAGGPGDIFCIGFQFPFFVNGTATQPGGITNSPTSTYLHTLNTAAEEDGILCSSFAAADGICIFADNVFAKMNTDVNTTGYSSVDLNFWWNLGGATGAVFGEVYYSTNNGTTWNQVTTPISQYSGQIGWVQQTISIPAFTGQNDLRFGFRFVNNAGAGAPIDPGFSLDDIEVIGHSPIEEITTLPTSSLSYCQGDFITVDFTSTATFNAGNAHAVQLSDELGSFAAPTAIGFINSTASAGSIPCIIPALQTPGAAYRVRVVSTDPPIIGADNGEDLAIVDCSIIMGCMGSSACNYDSTATVDDGSCSFPGCDDSQACNYDSTAGCNDGSCDYVSCIGCTDSAAWNYDSTATMDSGCCFYLDPSTLCGLGTIWSVDLQQCLTICQADMNFDGAVNTADLLEFLVLFGAACP
jgi:hypothetical protein